MNTVQKVKHWKSYINQKVILNEGIHSTDRGQLLDIGSNFLVLAVKRDYVCYHQLYHVNDVSLEQPYENSTFDHSADNDTPNGPDYFHSLNFRSLLRLHIGKEALINEGDPHTIKGILLDVTRNFLILKADKDVLYFSIDYIKTIMETHNPVKDHLDAHNGYEPFYVHAHSYDRLFQMLEGSEISIQNGHHEEARGLLLLKHGRFILDGKNGSAVIDTDQIRSVKHKAQPGKENPGDYLEELTELNKEQHSRDNVYSQVIKTVDFHWKK